jgi:hypothetical protein
MAKQVINVGASSNDGTGDTLRVSQQKANANFTELYDRGLQQVTDVGNSTTNSINSTTSVQSTIDGNIGVFLDANGALQISTNGVYRVTVIESISADRTQYAADKDGIQCVVNPADNFANDTTASAGGIAIGQYYHTAGVVKIRLT